jgi:hypothetical protein
MPVLALGGDASFAPASALLTAFAPVAGDLAVDVITKAGY